MNHSRISGAQEALVGRAGFGMPTLDHPVGGTCVAVGHPEARTGSEPGGVVGVVGGWGGGDISSVKGRDRAVGSSGRCPECARLLGTFPAAVVASLGGVSVRSLTGEACCCCACGEFRGG